MTQARQNSKAGPLVPPGGWWVGRNSGLAVGAMARPVGNRLPMPRRRRRRESKVTEYVTSALLPTRPMAPSPFQSSSQQIEQAQFPDW